MDNRFFEQPILNSPYEYPARHWELDEKGQPTQQIIEKRRSAKFITPIPKPKKRKNKDTPQQQEFVFDEGKGLSNREQQYDPTPIINALRRDVDKWRTLKNPNDWKVTPETARLIQHWRHHKFDDIRLFFCQVEAIETAIWLTELIDSRQLESGDALDKNFRNMAADEINRFRREIIEHTGDRRQAENITDHDLLREVMNTVGKQGRLGELIRCVVSVSMLTEGWDADILGIPFDFTAKPVIAPPQPLRETIHVKAVRPDRDALEIKFPRVQGYRVELPKERLTAEFNEDSVLELTPDIVGPSITKNQGIIGEDVDLSLEHLEDMRRSTLLFHITKRLLYTKWRDPDKDPELHLFGQLKRITRQWLDNCLICKGGRYPAQLMYQELADIACERITAAITRSLIGERPVKAVLDPYNPTGSTIHVNFNTSKKNRWQTDSRRCHINWVILDSDWEAEFCRVAESHPKVKAYMTLLYVDKKSNLRY